MKVHHTAALMGMSVMICLVTVVWGTLGQGSADVIFRNGMIVTLNPVQPQAQAIAVIGDRIAAVGTNVEIDAMKGRTTRSFDLEGKLVIPGLIESHGHFLGIGQAKLVLDLMGTTNERQIADMVKARTAELKPGEWILGRGWDQNDWARREFPTSRSITEAAPRHPVYLARVDGHAGWVNQLGLELAGVKKDSMDPPGGRIVRDGAGYPTGVLIDRAQELVTRVIPPPSRDQMKHALLLAVQECVASGLTGFHDAGTSREVLGLYRELIAERRLDIRVYVMLAGSDDELLREAFARGPEVGLGDHRLTIRAIKLVADGALGSRGAALLEEYADDPGNKGLLILTEEQIRHVADQALSHGFQACAHAIGDRANRVVLDAYEKAFKKHPGVKDPRFRIEHAQILDEADIPRFAKLGVIASMQATHCTSDMPWVQDRIGEARAREGAYVWRKLTATGARIANGSDAPVESVNPLWGLYAAVTRQDQRGKPPGGWYPDQRMTLEQALSSFTREAAYAAFEEDTIGSLETGKLADLVVLSKDITTVDVSEIPQTRVALTVLGGKIVYDAGALNHDRR